MKTIDKSTWEPLHTDAEKCAAQVDSVVDMWYYSLNAFCKKCIDPSSVFNVVQDANMAKRDPTTGQFNIRESDGKIIKPVEWTPPDIVKEIRKQIHSARWTNCLDELHKLTTEYKQSASEQRIQSLLSFIKLDSIGCPTFYCKDDFIVISWEDINIYVCNTSICILDNEFKYVPVSQDDAIKLIEKEYK
jgi:hypothetical protein